MDEYLSAELMTPKRRLVEGDPELQRELLLDSQQLKLIRVVYEQSPQGFDDATEAASQVAHLVRQTVDFVPTSTITPPLSSEVISESEVTNCFGYAIIASECLEQIGIEHFVGYANQHSFLTLFDRTSNRAFLLDVATKELCCDMTDAIGGEDPLNQLAVGALRAENTLYSNELLKQLPPSVNREQFVDKRPWLGFDGTDLTQFREYRPADRILQLFTLPSIPGRLLLQQQYNAGRWADRGDLDRASDEFLELAGLYLDVDPRNNLKHIDGLRKKLMAVGKYDAALRLAVVVSESLVAGDTSKNQFFLPDALRDVAKRTSNKALAEWALVNYMRLSDTPLRAGKIAATRKLLRDL